MAKGNSKKTRGKRRPDGKFNGGGNPGNSGGKPGRSGRKPDWFHEQCRQAIEDNNLIQVVVDIANAKRTSERDRIAAVRFLAGYAVGKPPETVKVEGEIQHTHSPADRILAQLDAMQKRSDGKTVRH